MQLDKVGDGFSKVGKAMQLDKVGDGLAALFGNAQKRSSKAASLSDAAWNDSLGAVEKSKDLDVF